jgi:hypothetical protein
MKYSLKNIAGSYIKEFNNFIEKNKIVDASNSELYDLFSFSIKSIYGLASSESNYYIDMYGSDCITSLLKIKGVPKKIGKLDINTRLDVVLMCQNYYVALGHLFENRLK